MSDSSNGKFAWDISNAFSSGSLDLSQRPKAPVVGWSQLPECIFANELRERGESDATVRLSLTFIAAMDRARNADELWRRGLRLQETDRWTYDIDEILRRPLYELADVLMAAGVSQRHLADSAAWRRVAESLRMSGIDWPVRRVIEAGSGSATRLLEDLASTTPRGSARFPFLGGPKIGPMWVRMMVHPGGAGISNMEIIPVAVDVQVRRVTEMLQVSDTCGMDLGNARGPIQDAWFERAQAEGVDAPGILANTTAGLDPALWFFARWGCSYCEPLGRRVPVSTVCSSCRLGRSPTVTSQPRRPQLAGLQEARTGGGQRLIGLVGCVKTKLDHRAPARDLYTSRLFQDRRSAVEGRADRWFILSAEYGLIDPDTPIAPYDRSLADCSIRQRREWASRVLSDLRAELGDLRTLGFEIHAGENYFNFGLADGLRRAGAAVSIPTKGLGIGKQRHFYHRDETSQGDQRDAPLASTGGKWGRLADLVDVRGGTEVRLSFEEIEDFIGSPLPRSAQKYPAWWSSRPWTRYWHSRGWRGVPRLRERTVIFRRQAVPEQNEGE